MQRYDDAEQIEAAKGDSDDALNRLRLVKMVDQLMDKGASTEEIVDTIIHELTPTDGDECPVCGICP